AAGRVPPCPLPPSAGLHRMDAHRPQFLLVGSGRHQRCIAYLREPGDGPARPGVIWLAGLKSEMTSTKASALADWARKQGVACLRFDYSGHGQSQGRFEDGTLGRWLEETRAAFAGLTSGPQVVVGSSMGGGIALLLLRELMTAAPQEAERVKALVLIAPAWDMAEMIWSSLSASARQEVIEKRVYIRPSGVVSGLYSIRLAFSMKTCRPRCSTVHL